MANTPLRVLYTYVPTAPDEVGASEGDLLMGLSEDQGWWRVSHNGKVGLFPGNYVEVEQAPAETKDVRLEMKGAGAAAGAGGGRGGGGGAKKKGGGGGGGARPPANNLTFCAWGYNMAIASVLYLVTFGLAGVWWGASDQPRASDHGSVGLGIYSWFVAVVVASLEWFYGYQVPLTKGFTFLEKNSPLHKFPTRGVLYMVLSLPAWFSVSTIMGAGALFATGAIDAYGVYRGEYGTRKNRTRVPKSDNHAEKKFQSKSELLKLWIKKQIDAGEVGKWIILLLFVAVNVIYGLYLFVVWNKKVADAEDLYSFCLSDPLEARCQPFPLPPVSRWGPFAKTAGGLLNMNCAFLIFPILRGLLRALNNQRIGATGTLATYIPLRKNIGFHKLIAKYVAVLAFVHVAAHALNYGKAPIASVMTFPNPTNNPWYGYVKYAPFYTGAIITMSMQYIYSAASPTVKHAQYEIFWVCHQLFVLAYFVALIFHGPVFIYWTLVPLALYVAERVWRVKRGQRRIYLKTIKWIPPVLELDFCPKFKEDLNFVEGQYLYINCPYLSTNEWHPFTISSARGDLEQEDFVSVHIRVHKGGWTERLKNYLEEFNPTKQYPLHLWRRNGKGELKHGKDRGPDGQQLIRIDGPHSAPAQCYGAYHTVMLIGAGIGLTPAAAIIRAILRYKWKKGYQPETIYFYWVVRQSEIDSFQWFVQMLSELQAERQRDISAGNAAEGNLLQMHIFVTRCDRNYKTPPLRENVGLSPGMLQYSSFTPQQLLDVMTHPPVKASLMLETLTNPSAARNRLQDIWLWDGRPDWDKIYSKVKLETKVKNPGGGNQIGVLFCGAAIIGKDLKAMAEKHSSKDEGVQFQLHKENF